MFVFVIYFRKGKDRKEGGKEEKNVSGGIICQEQEFGVKTLDPAAETDSLNGRWLQFGASGNTRPHPTVTHRGGQGSSSQGGRVRLEQDFLIIHDKCNRTQEALLSTI